VLFSSNKIGYFYFSITIFMVHPPTGTCNVLMKKKMQWDSNSEKNISDPCGYGSGSTAVVDLLLVEDFCSVRSSQRVNTYKHYLTQHCCRTGAFYRIRPKTGDVKWTGIRPFIGHYFILFNKIIEIPCKYDLR
jgi:hypothetical protein